MKWFFIASKKPLHESSVKIVFTDEGKKFLYLEQLVETLCRDLLGLESNLDPSLQNHIVANLLVSGEFFLIDEPVMRNWYSIYLDSSVRFKIEKQRVSEIGIGLPISKKLMLKGIVYTLDLLKISKHDLKYKLGLEPEEVTVLLNRLYSSSKLSRREYGK